MSPIKIAQYIFIGILFLLFQIYVVKYLIIYNFAVPFVFFLFLFMLPTSIPSSVEYVVGFFMGLIIDISGDTLGANASAVLFALAVKRQIVGTVTATVGFRDSGEINLSNQNFVWYVTYLISLIFAHHLVYFLLESFNMANIAYTLFKIVVSTLYSFIINYLVCITFYKK